MNLKINVDEIRTSASTTPNNKQKWKKTSETSRKLKKVSLDTHKGRKRQKDVYSDILLRKVTSLEHTQHHHQS